MIMLKRKSSFLEGKKEKGKEKKDKPMQMQKKCSERRKRKILWYNSKLIKHQT